MNGDPEPGSLAAESPFHAHAVRLPAEAPPRVLAPRQALPSAHSASRSTCSTRFGTSSRRLRAVCPRCLFSLFPPQNILFNEELHVTFRTSGFSLLDQSLAASSPPPPPQRTLTTGRSGLQSVALASPPARSPLRTPCLHLI